MPAECGAWNPGLESQLPREYLPLSTVFRGENVSTSLAKAYELSDYCGLPPHELIAFRPERLIVHELLIHITTGIAVPDGRDDEDLGRNFRGIAANILNRYIAPHHRDLARVFEELKHNASIVIAAELENALAQPKLPARIDQPRHPRWLFTSKPKKAAAPPFETVSERDQRVVSAWLEQLHKAGDRLRASCFADLHRIATAIISRHGQLLGDEALLGEL